MTNTEKKTGSTQASHKKSKSFEERLHALNDRQREAVETIDGPLLVVAGPGSGKTELLSLRVGNILRKTGVAPHNILCLTFTENGALAMRERLATLIGADAYRTAIFTFHAFCNHVISRFPEYFFQSAHFTQATDVKRAELLETIFKSLPYGHPMGSYHPEKGYVYLHDVKDRIKHIKSYGYTSDEYQEVVSLMVREYAPITEALSAWPGRVQVKDLGDIKGIIETFKKLKSTTSIYLAKSLEEAVALAELLGKAEPLSSWKAKYTVKDNGVLMLKDEYNKEKILAVAELYTKYSKAMYEEGLYDYDDMIIEVAHALREEESLRTVLEEQYQYILVDEFQDTNEAQMSLIEAITRNEIHEGSPNVCVVGDDDQAIYKFQGAEVSHMMRFREHLYRNVKTVVLDSNYRSTQGILDASRQVITQIVGGGRLENAYQDISKVLTSKNIHLPKGAVTFVHTLSDVSEYTLVADRIREALDQGVNPDEVAVLARSHRELRALLPYLDRKEIPYEYEKKANVFDEPHVKILIEVCDYLSSVIAHEHQRDYLLPRLLSYPCFGVRREDLFTLSLFVKEKHISWSEGIRSVEVESIASFGKLLTTLAVDAPSTPLEHVLEIFMEKSGFKEYYFSQELIQKSPTTYVSFLASLKTFVEALREWREGEMLFVYDVAPFVAMHVDHAISLVSISPFLQGEHTVKLMSAHASKGLEFEHVYIISAHDSLWTKSPRTNIAPLPAPLLPLMQPAGDTEEDFIRLLYVAMTRAKHTLHITSHDAQIRYLPEPKEHIELEEVPVESHENALRLYKEPFREEEWALLRRLVKDYRMPVTHLNNFLNLAEGGPLYFVEQNLLRFPQPMNPSGVYGSAIHKVIEECVMYPKYNGGEKVHEEYLLAVFYKELSRGRLPHYEELKLRGRGEKIVKKLLEEIPHHYTGELKVEVDMKDEGVMVGDAHLIGKIDLLEQRDGMYTVVDFKTGKAFSSWDSAVTDLDKIKLHKYRQQLIVYKLLLENSNHYKGMPVGKLALNFVEEDVFTELVLDSDEVEIERTKKLVEAVYHKIVTLQITPDLSKYEPTYKGMRQFEDDLIGGM